MNAVTATKPLKFTRPLVSVWAVLSVTDLKGEDEVLEAVEDGRLLFAFNIASRNAKARDVRVLSDSVCAFVEGRRLANVSEEQDWQRVLRLIFPSPAPTIQAKEIALALNASSSHIIKLIEERLLRLAKGTPWFCGRGGSPRVEYQSAVDFLKARRIF
jgi:hypothetical protein